ncbi:MAG: [NiFe]-hydrogenase assembly chaperone HybE [Rhodocyclaceae bacterium]|nr:[NiFe]-hydrogenase assembly chaperone HybE [Rhodocyclaceae bacterium]
MSETLRKPAWTPPPVVHAGPHLDDPSRLIGDWFARVFAERMAGLPFLNPLLSVEVIGVRRVDGDWLGGLVTPWSVQLVLLPGGGTLWVDTPAGVRRRVALPVGELWFLADAGDEGLEAYQYCALGTSTEGFPDQAAARCFVAEALATVMAPPPGAPDAASPEPASPAVDRGRRALFGMGRRR